MRRLAATVVALAAVGLAGCGGGPNVVSDLKALFNDKNVSFQSVDFCTHQTGNEYICQVTSPQGTQETVNVTDDGKSIYEQGYDSSQ